MQSPNLISQTFPEYGRGLIKDTMPWICLNHETGLPQNSLDVKLRPLEYERVAYIRLQAFTATEGHEIMSGYQP
jgi:hypothetical protein